MRIVIADAQPNVRFAIRTLLERQPEVEIVGEAASLEMALRVAIPAEPDVLLLDCALPGLNEASPAALLRAICPGVQVVALGSRPGSRRAALAAGADAFVCKGDPPSELLGVLGRLTETECGACTRES